MKHLALIVVAALSGCAPGYRTPCTVQATIRLVDEGEADAICRREIGVSENDRGQRLSWKSVVRACVRYSDNLIVTPDDPDLLWHEAKHLWDRNCR